MFVQGEDDMCGIMKVLDWGVSGEEMVPNKECEFQEEPELDCPAVARALGVFAVPEAEVEAQLDQVGNVPGLWVGGGGSCGHDGLDNAQGDGFSLLDWRIFYPISFELTGKVPVQADVSLGVGGISGVG